MPPRLSSPFLVFYQTIYFLSEQVRTDVARSSLQPKFLKDVRMGVPDPEMGVLRVSLSISLRSLYSA